MSTKQEDRLANLEQAVHGIAGTQKSHGDLLRMLVEGQQEIIRLLTPEPKDVFAHPPLTFSRGMDDCQLAVCA